LSSAATREGSVSTEGEEPANSATLIRCCLEESGDGVTAVGPVDGTAVNCTGHIIPVWVGFDVEDDVRAGARVAEG